METIRCNLVKDLLPLYVDDVVSQETAQEVRCHLESCDSCRAEYERLKQELVLPVDLQQESAQALQAIKQKLRWKRVAVAVTSVLVTMVVIFSGMLVFENVGVVHNFFDPVLRTGIRNSQTEDWQLLPFPAYPFDITKSDTVETLKFDSLFFSREVINDAASGEPVTLRILDENNAVVVEPFTIRSGERAPLKELKRGREYRVEVRFSGEDAFLNFC